ncbi:MAG: adenine-specific methyltransferase EcoRI family protein [Chitinophagales bacterium]|nr:adenine-specific methyltransferase EcoRI family protein [Chitinophagales bacterium]
MANSNLSNAKNAKNDEFYTQYADIEKEIMAYLEYNPEVFRNKTILLPCDDPEWSNFTKFFAQNFERFGLQKLISTSYAHNSKNYKSTYQPTIFETKAPHYDETKTIVNGKIFTLTADNSGDNKINIDDLQWQYLVGDGDFRSKEIKKLRDEADIIITNPPFSLFREFLAWIVAANKQFLIIGNMNAITYKEVFPLIKENKAWLGATNFNTGMYFKVPSDFVYADTYKFERERNGEKVNRVPGVCWFTNLDHGRRHNPLPLMTMEDNLKFNKKLIDKESYDRYDNYDAIEVPFTDAIPSDYDGIMGVPISFLDKYCPEQFEILGATQRGCHDEVPDTKKYDDYWEVKQSGEKTGSSGGKTNENANLLGNDGKKNYFINKEGRIIQSAYQRIFIKHKKQ